MRSCSVATPAQLPGDAPQRIAAPSWTSAIFPPDAARLVVPVTSGAGRALPTVPVGPSWTRRCRPGAIEPASGVTDQVLPAEVAYCTDHELTSTDVPPRLNSST